MRTLETDKGKRIVDLISEPWFWIVVFFVVRLTGITNPPLEIGHNWRQSLTCMITRNFYLEGADIFYPKIDMAGNKSGIIGAEFPFFNYLSYLFCKLFGYSHWYGRLINLIVSSLGIFWFSRFVQSLWNKQTAVYATIILSVSVWFAFARKIMPDTFSISLMMGAIYYATEFLRGKKTWVLLPFSLLASLGVLCKIPAIYFFAALPAIFLLPEISFKRKIAISVVSVISVIPALWWYFIWVPHLVTTYGYQLFFPMSLGAGFKDILPYIPELLEKFYFSALHSFAAFAAFLFGLFILIRKKENVVLAVYTLLFTIFFVFILKTGSVFPLHSYYIIPFVPLMALTAAIGLNHLKKNLAVIILAIIVIEGIANQQHDFFLKESEKYKSQLDQLTEKYIPKDSLILINGGPSPQEIYFSNRKGWTIRNEVLLNADSLSKLNAAGATYLIINRHTFKDSVALPGKIFSDENYSIYDL